jgi:hypothetical protein
VYNIRLQLHIGLVEWLGEFFGKIRRVYFSGARSTLGALFGGDGDKLHQHNFVVLREECRMGGANKFHLVVQYIKLERPRHYDSRSGW